MWTHSIQFITTYCVHIHFPNFHHHVLTSYDMSFMTFVNISQIKQKNVSESFIITNQQPAKSFLQANVMSLIFKRINFDKSNQLQITFWMFDICPWKIIHITYKLNSFVLSSHKIRPMPHSSKDLINIIPVRSHQHLQPPSASPLPSYCWTQPSSDRPCAPQPSSCYLGMRVLFLMNHLCVFWHFFFIFIFIFMNHNQIILFAKK